MTVLLDFVSNISGLGLGPLMDVVIEIDRRLVLYRTVASKIMFSGSCIAGSALNFCRQKIAIPGNVNDVFVNYQQDDWYMKDFYCRNA